MRTGIIYHLILSLMMAFQSCQDSRLYPDDEASTIHIREVAKAMLEVGKAIRNYSREVEAMPESVEILEQRGYLALNPDFRSQWNLSIRRNYRDHLLIESLSTEKSPVGQDLKLIYDFTDEKWLRPYKIR